MPHAFYLGGDSYPGDAHCEEQVIQALTQKLGLTFTRQSDLMPADPEAAKNWLQLSSRFEQIEKRLTAIPDKETVILIGRSSGSRVATRFAYDYSSKTKTLGTNIAAIICFAYPFRAPKQTIDPSRFAHLADIKIPTLIIQGRQDEYGGADVTDNYTLSPAIEFLPVDADHGVNLSEEDWEKVFERITTFLTKTVHQFKTRRAAALSKYKEQVFNRSVYYFGDIESSEAKNHYSDFLRYTDEYNQRHPETLTVSPLQWDEKQTFWNISLNISQQDSESTSTQTRYHFFDWNDVARSYQVSLPTNRWHATKKQLKNLIAKTRISTIFKNDQNTNKNENAHLTASIISDLDPALVARLNHHATQLIKRLQANTDEEVLLTGQGVGSLLAIKCLIRAYELNPSLFEQKTKVCLLTYGLHDQLEKLNPQSDQLKHAFAKLKQSTGLQSIDIASSNEIAGFDLKPTENNLQLNNLEQNAKYDYLAVIAGSESFRKIFGLKSLPDIPINFDPAVYLELNPDIEASGLEPIWHWQHHGAAEERRFHMSLPFGFNAETYFRLNPDVAESNMDAAHHYLFHGEKENRLFID